MTALDLPPLAVLVLSDGLPGHVNQSRGLVRWLGERFAVRAEELPVALRARPLSRRLLPAAINRGLASPAAYRAFHRGAVPGSRPGLIVSAGGNTAFANVLLARHFGCPNVFLGSKRRLSGACFTAHLTLEPTGEASNIVLNVAPSVLSRQDIAAGGRRFAAARGLVGERLWLMACGGDGAGKVYRESHWRALGEWMNDLAERWRIRWLVSTSRRTGAAGERALREALVPANVAYGVWWSARAERILGDLMGAAERLFVTVDSMSMISECIAAGKPLALVHGGAGEPDQRYRAALAKYERLGLCRNVAVGAPCSDADDAPPPPASLFAAQLDELAARIGRPC